MPERVQRLPWTGQQQRHCQRGRTVSMAKASTPTVLTWLRWQGRASACVTAALWMLQLPDEI